MTFDVKNIEGWMRDGRIHILGSGHMLAPFKENDWIRTNFGVPKVAGVHVGYLVAALRVADAIGKPLTEMVEKMPEDAPLVISGYSLGGSVAEVLGTILLFLPQLKDRRIEVHNFGGPAPFGLAPSFIARAAKAVDITWYSAGTDIVPYLMFWNRHGGRHKHIKTGKWNPFENHLVGYIDASFNLQAKEVK